MKYDSGNYPSFQQLPKQHNAHVLAYTLHKLDFEQMEMRALYGAYKRPRTEKMDSMFNRIINNPAFSFENAAEEAWIKANPEKHDAHVKAYHQDFLSQLLNIYKQNCMLYISLCMLKPRPKSPSNITIDFSHFRQYHTGKTQLSDSINNILFGYDRAMDEDKDRATDQTYKKRKHIPNNQEEQKARKAKLLAKNKFFRK